jgi:hypothetical protein
VLAHGLVVKDRKFLRANLLLVSSTPPVRQRRLRPRLRKLFAMPVVGIAISDNRAEFRRNAHHLLVYGEMVSCKLAGINVE